MPQKIWISIVEVLIVLGAFAVVITSIIKILRSKCNDKTQMFDKGWNKCRKICDYDINQSCTDCTHWDYSTKKCEPCPSGMTWNNNTATCIEGCSGNGAWWGGSKANNYTDGKCICAPGFAGKKCDVTQGG